MKSIELTFKNGKKIQVVLGGNALIYQESDDTVIELGGGMGFNGGVRVKETPQEIADLINGRQDLGWAENTGIQPCGDDELVSASFANGGIETGTADDFQWKKGTDISVVKYKLINRGF